MNIKTILLTAGALLLLSMVFLPAPVRAHQPYCEFADVTIDTPWQVPDSTISYAYYGNLYPAGDVDYFTFDAEEGQSVLLSLSIPAIDGQEDFAPIMALYGPGVEGRSLMALAEGFDVPANVEAIMVDVGEEPEYWFEPFGGRYYWNWDNTFFEAPEDGAYTVALWHPDNELGRYSFVVGEKEEFGGDRDCSASFDKYWTPLVAGENPYRDGEAEMASHVHEDGMAHDHGKAMELSADNAPIVDLQVLPLSDGSYNIRVQTMNFIFAPQNVDGDPVDGEGHAHLYVDGEKIARLYGEWYHVSDLPEDAAMISVALYANNHQPLAVDGDPISDMVMLSDTMTDNGAMDDEMASMQ